MATVFRAPPLVLQFFGNNNLLLVGGTLQLQVGGVNTPGYQDAAGTTPLPNPIPLNSRGEISNAAGISQELWLLAANTYTATLFDALGNQINQYPNFAGTIDASSAASIAGNNTFTGTNTFTNTATFSGNITVIDTKFTILNAVDPTKKIAFDASAITTGQTRTTTMVDYNSRIMTQTHGADIISAATINLDTATGDLVDVTGVVSITAITLADGKSATVRFTGALILTSGASLILPGGINYTTTAGDIATFRGYAAGVVRLVSFQFAKSGSAGGAAQTLLSVQVASASASITFTGIDTSYDEYLIVIKSALAATSGTTFQMQVGDGGGLKATTYQYHFAYLSSGAATYAANASTGNTAFVMGTDVSNVHGLSGEVRLFGFGDAGQFKTVNIRLGGVRATGIQTFSTMGDGQWAGGTGALTQVQFTESSGNITSGTFYLYCIKKS